MAFANHLCGSRDRMDLHFPELDFSQPISGILVGDGLTNLNDFLQTGSSPPSLFLGGLHHSFDDLDRNYLEFKANQLKANQANATNVVDCCRIAFCLWMALPELVHNFSMASYWRQPNTRGDKLLSSSRWWMVTAFGFCVD